MRHSVVKYKPYPREAFTNWSDWIDANWKNLRLLDRAARSEGSWVGRIVRHSYADGYSTYQVVREYKNTVQISLCSGLGDDWVLPAWGMIATIKKEIAENLFLGDHVY